MRTHPVQREPPPVPVQPIPSPTTPQALRPDLPVATHSALALPGSPPPALPLPTPRATPLPPSAAPAPLHSALASLRPSDPASPLFSLSPDRRRRLRSVLCPLLELDPSSAASQLFIHFCLSHPHPPSAPDFYLQQAPPSKRSRLPSPPLLRRQSTQGDGTGPFAEGYPGCTAVSNAVLSCFPQSNTTLVQNTWSKFIWNNNYPTFIGARTVDIYLFNAQSESIVANWTSVANDRGMIGIYAGDDWFPNQTSWVNGQNRTFPYFFVITGNGMALTGGEQHQATFTVVQTAAPLSLVSASAAAFSSTFLHNATHTSTAPIPASTGTSSLQQASSGDSFPRWQIALIVVLGVLALITFLVATYLTVHNARRRRQIRNWRQVGLGGSGGSVASHSPMIQNPEGAALIGIASKQRAQGSPTSSRPGSPLSATATATGGASLAYPPHPLGSIAAGSQTGPTDLAGPDGPISSVDASIMADAFRKALRKPEFEPTSQDNTPEDEEPPAQDTLGSVPPAPPRTRESMKAQVVSMDEEMGGGMVDDDEDDEEAREIMDRELASEGRSMTSVDVRKRPEVHS